VCLGEVSTGAAGLGDVSTGAAGVAADEDPFIEADGATAVCMVPEAWRDPRCDPPFDEALRAGGRIGRSDTSVPVRVSGQNGFFEPVFRAVVFGSA
jgi:hypothetical protein